MNVPLRLLDKPFGAFGTGTFGDEGCRPPTHEELDYLIGMANQLAVAAGRIRFLEERKRSEEALKKTEEQLRHAQKMETIGRLAGSVAHDFNNLLSVILGHGSFLLEDLKTADPIREDIAAIVAAGERAADLTRQLLAFSRRQVLAPRVLDLNAVVRDSEKMIRRLLRADIELVTRYDRDLVRVKVDPGQVDQIVMNLAVNARDAMPDGGKLTIETRRAELDDAYASEHFDVTPGLHAMLAVSDTGIPLERLRYARGTCSGETVTLGVMRLATPCDPTSLQPKSPHQTPSPRARTLPNNMYECEGGDLNPHESYLASTSS